MMKGVIINNYGKPDQLIYKTDIIKPIPKDNEVLIKIHNAVVGPADCAFRKADPFIVRLMFGLFKPKYKILGVELSGEIEQIGKNVKTFNIGDQVFGISADTFGSYAEYICLQEKAVLVKKSDKISHEDAVGIADGAATSLIFLRDVAKIQKDQKIIINGASGAVGVYGIQLAKYYGAHVTCVCSSVNIELVKSLGADEVIDYTKQKFTEVLPKYEYDIVFDAVGKSSYGACKHLLKKKTGKYLTTVPSFAILFQMLYTGKRANFVPTGLMQKKENFEFLNELAETGKLKSVIDRRYTLEQIPEAHAYVDTGRKKGNVVITIV